VETEYGPWCPMAVDEAVETFDSSPFRWWVTGGHALELHMGRSWRAHDDTDLSFCRQDAGLVRDLLSDWDVHVAAAGVLTPWTGTPLRAEAHQNNLWCKRNSDGPWCLDLTISDGDDADWIFRRDPSVRVPWRDAVLTSRNGIPYLAPQLQLLFKAGDRRSKDDLDAAETIPSLDSSARAFLAAALPPDHHWMTFMI